MTSGNPQPVSSRLQLKVPIRENGPEVRELSSNGHPIIPATPKVELPLAFGVFADPSFDPFASLLPTSANQEFAFLRVRLHFKISEGPKNSQNFCSNAGELTFGMKDPPKMKIVCEHGASLSCPASAVGSIKTLLNAFGEQPPQRRRQDATLVAHRSPAGQKQTCHFLYPVCGTCLPGAIPAVSSVHPEINQCLQAGHTRFS